MGSGCFPHDRGQDTNLLRIFKASFTAVSAYIARKKRHNRTVLRIDKAALPQPLALNFYVSQYARDPPSRQERRIRQLRPSPTRSLYQKSRCSAAELAPLKARTRCHYCREKGHWRQECLNRKHSMTAAVRARIKDRGGPPAAFAEVLYAISKEEDAY